MELDDFKRKNFPDNPPGIDQIISSFKDDMNKQRKTFIYVITILLSLSIIYIAQGLRNIAHDNSEGNILGIGYGLITAGFILGAVYLYFRYRPLSGSFYSLPMADFLDKAEKRLKYLNVSDWLIIILLLIILGTGGGIVFITSLLKYSVSYKLLLVIWILFFLFLSGFGIRASRKDWQKAHGQLLYEIQELKEILNREGN